MEPRSHGPTLQQDTARTVGEKLAAGAIRKVTKQKDKQEDEQ